MIRKYEEADLAFLQEGSYEFFELQYHNDVIKGEVYTSCDDQGKVNGLLFFRYHNTWQYCEPGDYNRIIAIICTEDEVVYNELLEYSINWLNKQTELCEDKNACLVLWEDSKERTSIQNLLRHGFIADSVCPCLKHDLLEELKVYPIPKGMRLERLVMDPEQVHKYITATGKANNGVLDSENEMWFMTGEPTYEVYVLMDQDTIVSSASLWKITDTRAAIENIFTDPDYRRRGMSRITIMNTLGRIKELGYEIATLSMSGSNLKASRLYQSLGFELF